MDAPTPSQRLAAPAGATEPDARQGAAPVRPLQRVVGMERLDRLLAAARATGTPLPHLLLIADAPGTNLTPQVAEIVAEELGRALHVTRCHEVDSIDALLQVLAQTHDDDILYLDNVDALPQLISDTLSLSLECGTLEYVIADEPGAPVHSVALPQLTIIGAAPSRSLLGSALTPHFAEQIDARTLGVQWRTRISARQARAAAAASSMDDVVALLTRHTRKLVEGRVRRGALRAETSSVEVRGVQQHRRAIISYTVAASRLASQAPAPGGSAEGLLALDARTGNAVEASEERYIIANAAALLRHAGQADAGSGQSGQQAGTTRGARGYDPVRAKALQRITAKHTTTTRRQGLGGVAIKRTYTPLPDDISLRVTEVPIVVAEGAMRIGDRGYVASWIVGGGASVEPALLRTTLPDELSLCETCGYVDNKDWSCLYCKRRACVHCAPPVFKQYCSRECYDQKQHETLLAKIDDAEVRSRIEESGERLTQVARFDQLTLALTGETAYLAEQHIASAGRDDTLSFRVETEGMWPLRKWRLVAMSASGAAPQPLATLADRDRAELLVTILDDWLHPR